METQHRTCVYATHSPMLPTSTPGSGEKVIASLDCRRQLGPPALRLPRTEMIPTVSDSAASSNTSVELAGTVMEAKEAEPGEVKEHCVMSMRTLGGSVTEVLGAGTPADPQASGSSQRQAGCRWGQGLETLPTRPHNQA